MEPFDNSSNGIGCGKPARQNITPIFLKALIAAWHDIGSLFHINTRKHLFRFQVVNVTPPALLTFIHLRNITDIIIVNTCLIFKKRYKV